MSIFHLQALEIAIVTNSQDISKMDKNTVKRLFLGKINHLNNIQVNLVELQDTNYKEEFYKTLTSKNTAQLRSYWTRLIFTGKGKPPKQVASQEELTHYMMKSDVIITYIPLESVQPNMSVLYILKK
jgi:hypothetical protein